MKLLSFVLLTLTPINRSNKMNALSKIWSGIEKNRWTTIVPVVGLILWIVVCVSCTPTTESPIGTGVKVNAAELERDYETWKISIEQTAKRFEFAAANIEKQQEQWSKITSVLMQVASGGVTNYSGLLNVVLASGLLGVGADNVRKNGVIGGLKRNKDPVKK